MGLFNSNDLITKSKKTDPSSIHVEESNVLTALGDKLSAIKEVIGNISTGAICHYCTEGRFSAHELLFYLLTLTGPAHVYISTWKISQEPASKIVAAKNEGLIKDLHIFVERRMKIKSPNALQLIRASATSFGMDDNHSKTFAIDCDGLPLAVVLTANFSENRRVESGVIHASAAAMDFHKNWIKKNIDKCQKI